MDWRRLQNPGAGSDHVFPTTVTDRTRLHDFLRAGLAREELILDEEGRPIPSGKTERSKPRTRIVNEDEQGRVLDLHALRTTLGTKLAGTRSHRRSPRR